MHSSALENYPYLYFLIQGKQNGIKKLYCRLVIGNSLFARHTFLLINYKNYCPSFFLWIPNSFVGITYDD